MARNQSPVHVQVTKMPCNWGAQEGLGVRIEDSSLRRGIVKPLRLCPNLDRGLPSLPEFLLPLRPILWPLSAMARIPQAICHRPDYAF